MAKPCMALAYNLNKMGSALKVLSRMTSSRFKKGSPDGVDIHLARMEARRPVG